MGYQQPISSKTVTKITVISSVIGALLVFSYFDYKNTINLPVDANNDTEISFQIKKGTTPREVTKNLKDEGLIEHDYYLYHYINSNDLGENIISHWSWPP